MGPFIRLAIAGATFGASAAAGEYVFKKVEPTLRKVEKATKKKFTATKKATNKKLAAARKAVSDKGKKLSARFKRKPKTKAAKK